MHLQFTCILLAMYLQFTHGQLWWYKAPEHYQEPWVWLHRLRIRFRRIHHNPWRWARCIRWAAFADAGLWGEAVVFIVHTPRGEIDHIISIRKAEKHEERIYWKNFPNWPRQPTYNSGWLGRCCAQTRWRRHRQSQNARPQYPPDQRTSSRTLQPRCFGSLSRHRCGLADADEWCSQGLVADAFACLSAIFGYSRRIYCLNSYFICSEKIW